MRRLRLPVLAGCVALAVSAAPAAAIALGSGPSLTVPTLSVPTVTAPSLTVPSVTVPSVTVPTITTGPITTPSVSTPTLTTPTLRTPTVTTPALTTPTVSTPSVPSSPVRTPTLPTSPTASQDHGSAPSSTGSSGTASTASVQPVGGDSTSGSRATSGGGQGFTRRAGHGGATGSAATATTGGHKAAASRVQTTPGTDGADTATAAPGGGASSSRSGPSASTPAGRSTKSNGPIARLVKVLPTAVLIALLAFAVVAAVMSLNAFLQRRRAKSLGGQRAALVSDVGVLQAALLPAVPGNLGELQVSVAYRPAQGLAAGGDFFDVFTVSPDRTGIIIGDVSGHGRESLIHAALVRYTLRTLMGEGHSLPEVLARADRYLTGELGDGFATVVICCYEHASDELTWAKAGHEPPIIAGQPEREEQAATPLGFGMGDVWPQFSRVLAPGERVCLFTDGLTEARRNGAQFGRAHLKSLVDQGLSAQALVERVQTDSDECNDDLAAVVISRAALGAETRLPQVREAATA